jgi:hypothetical protein
MPLGRESVKLHWQVAPLGTPFTATSIISGTSVEWTDTLTTGVVMAQNVTGLTPATPYHWRIRLLYRPGNRLGQAASRWVHMPWNGWNELNFRTPTEAHPPARCFRAGLSGDQVVPPVATSARGWAYFRLNDSETWLRFLLVAEDIVDATGAQIHCAPTGVNGPVGVTLFSGGSITIPGIALLARGFVVSPDEGNACGWMDLADVLAAMRAGETYVVYNTLAYPEGEVRGQILPVSRLLEEANQDPLSK